MTSLLDLWRRLDQIEWDLRQATHDDGDRIAVAWERLEAGHPTNSDIELLVDSYGAGETRAEELWDVAIALSRQDAREENLRGSPAFQLLADLLYLKPGSAKLDAGLAALLGLAADGVYVVGGSQRRAEPAQVGLARLAWHVVTRELSKPHGWFSPDGIWDISGRRS